MNLRKLILLILLFSVEIAYAQTDFRPGYIIKASGDTIHGAIDYRGDLIMSSTCRFKNAHNQVEEYSPADIIAYRFIDSKFYVSKIVNNKKVFLEYLIKGKVNVFYMRDDHGDHYYLSKEDEVLVEIPYEESIRYVNNTQVLYKSSNHIGLLNYFMQDAPELKSRIDRMKEPGHHNLIKIAEEYHYAVCDDEQCIIYEKHQPLLKVNLEIIAGVVNFYDKSLDLKDKAYFKTGMIAHFWMPRTNEKIFMKVGILYSRLEKLEGEEYNYVRIPLHIGYMAPTTYKVRPSFSFGVLSPSYSGGLMTKVSKNINVGVQGWADFYFKKIPWIPSQLRSYAMMGNVYIEF